jgi:hypothetical protein
MIDYLTVDLEVPLLLHHLSLPLTDGKRRRIEVLLLLDGAIS